MSSFVNGGLAINTMAVTSTPTSIAANMASRFVIPETAGVSYTFNYTDATDFRLGTSWEFLNRSNYPVNVNDSTGSLLCTIPARSNKVLHLINNATAAGSFDVQDGASSEPLMIAPTKPLSPKLYISGKRSDDSDGGSHLVFSSIGMNTAFPDTTIDFSTGIVTGGTVNVGSSTFSLPSYAVGQFTRMVLAYVPETSSLAALFSASQTLYSNLPDPSELVSQIAGRPLGHVDLVRISAGFKTAGSINDVIEARTSLGSTIVRYVSASSATDGVTSNYFTNPDGTKGLSTITQTGTMSVALEVVNPINGLQSFLITNGVGTTSYASWALKKVDAFDLRRPIYLSFNYSWVSVNPSVGDFEVYLYDLTNLTYVSPARPKLDAISGVYTSQVLLNANSTSYEFRILGKSASKQIVIDDLRLSASEIYVKDSKIPPRPITSGVIAGRDVVISGGTVLNSSFFAAINDDSVRITGSVVFGVLSGTIGLTFAEPYACDIGLMSGNGVNSTNALAGLVSITNGSRVNTAAARFVSTSAYTINVYDVNGAIGNANPPPVWATGDKILQFDLIYPRKISEKLGTLASNRLASLYNSNVTDADTLADGYSTGYAGGLVPSIATTAKTKRVRLPYNIIGYEKCELMIKPSSSLPWLKASDVAPYFYDGATEYGARITYGAPSGYIDVTFYPGGTVPGPSNLSWSSAALAGWHWKVAITEFIAQGELLPATELSAGIVTGQAQSIGGAKSFYVTGGSDKILDLNDDKSAVFYGKVTASDINKNAGFIPVGGIVPIIPYTGGYSIPASGIISYEGFMRCDGATIPSGPLAGQVLPNLTGSTFLLGTDGSSTGTAPNNNPVAGAAGGSNSQTTPGITISWSSTTVSTTFTNPVWTGSGSFNLSNLNAAQTAHSHSMASHTHPVYHSHSMRHVHNFLNLTGTAPSGTGNLVSANTWDYANSLVGASSYEAVFESIAVASGSGATVIRLSNNALTDRNYYTAGVTGENGIGDLARTGNELANSGAPNTTDTTTATVNFSGTQSVTVTGTNTSGAATFNKNAMNTNQNAHSHSLADTRPKYVAVIYLMRVQ